MFKISNMEKPVIIVSGVKFLTLCYILDFAYLGQAQVPHDSLDDFLKAGELLQIRGIKEGRIRYMTNYHQQQAQLVTTASAGSCSQSGGSSEPLMKRPRDEDESSIQEVSEIMKMLLESNPDMDVDQIQVKAAASGTTFGTTPHIPSELPFTPKAPQFGKPPVVQQQMKYDTPLPLARTATLVGEKKKFKCSFCNRSLTTNARMKKHENECNDNPNRVISLCPMCKHDVKPSALTSHLRTKHGQRRQSVLTTRAVPTDPLGSKGTSPVGNCSECSCSPQHDGSMTSSCNEATAMSPNENEISATSSPKDPITIEKPPVKSIQEIKIEKMQT